jgi:hypothetical protein
MESARNIGARQGEPSVVGRAGPAEIADRAVLGENGAN